MPIIVYVHIHLEIGYCKARDVMKDSREDQDLAKTIKEAPTSG